MTGEAERAPGAGVVRASWWGTVVFTLAAVVATLVDGLRALFVATALVLFVSGCGAFVAGFMRAVARSRREEVSIAGLFFLAGDVASPPVRRHLRWSLVAQVTVAVAAAAVRPYTALAFGVLVPVYGLALCGLWAARYGRFPLRRPRARRRPRESADGQ